MAAIARTMDVPNKIGEGKSIGYEALSSPSTAATSLLTTGAAGSIGAGSIFGGESFWEGNVGMPAGASSSSDARNWKVMRLLAPTTPTVDESDLGSDNLAGAGEKAFAV